MKLFIFIILIYFSVRCLASDSTLALEIGEQRKIKIQSGSSVVLTNPKAAKLIIQGNSATIIAKQKGMAEIRAGRAHYKVVVFGPQVAELRQLIIPWVSHAFGIQFEIRPDKILLTGKAHSIKDWIQVQRFKRDNSKILISDVRLAPELLKTLEQSINNSLKERALFGGRGQIHQGQIELLTFTKDKGQLAALKELAAEWGATVPLETQTVELKPMVEVEIVIAEIKKNSFQSLGLQMPGTYSATVLPAEDLSSATTTFGGITPQFHALFNDGTNKVLANPRLLCRSGESAHFVAGGEIPIKIMNWKTSDVIWKRYGVILDIFPLADLNGGISTKLVTEISLLDEAHTVDHIPGLLTNRIETHFDLRGSKTIALSGLIKSELGRGSTGVPLLGQIPILGELFKSRDYRDNRTELVVFVTPRIISPETTPGVKIPNFWQQNTPDDIR